MHVPSAKVSSWLQVWFVTRVSPTPNASLILVANRMSDGRIRLSQTMLRVLENVLTGNPTDRRLFEEADVMTSGIDSLVRVSRISPTLAIEAGEQSVGSDYIDFELKLMTHMCWLPEGVIPSGDRQKLPRVGPSHTTDIVSTRALCSTRSRSQRLGRDPGPSRDRACSHRRAHCVQDMDRQAARASRTQRPCREYVADGNHLWLVCGQAHQFCSSTDQKPAQDQPCVLCLGRGCCNLCASTVPRDRHSHPGTHSRSSARCQSNLTAYKVFTRQARQTTG